MVWAGAIAPVEGGAEQHEAPQHRHRVKLLLLKINHNSIIQKMLGVSTRTKASSTAGIVIVIVIIIIIII